MFYSPFILLSSLVAGAFGAARTTAPSGAIVVAKSGGDYTTIQEAVDSVTSGGVIFIQPGTYEEQVLIADTAGSLTIYGYTEDDQDYSKNEVTLTHSLGADEAGNNDSSGTLRAKNDGLKVYNVNVVNSRGEGVQAIALSAYGSEQGYYGCQFTGYQDTILSNEGYHYFHGCYIEGATDFIFGQRAIAWFDSCTIGISGSGYITASGRDSEDNPSWYVINKSTVTALSGVGDGETYLGRPWRTYARVVFQNSELGAVVNSAGWKAWGDNPTDNVYYGEFGNTGDGASGTRASFSQELSSAVVLADILGSTSWLDSDYISGTGSSDGAITSAVVSETPVVSSTPTSANVDATTLQTLVRTSSLVQTPNAPAASFTSAAASSTPVSSDDDCSGTPDGFASLNGGTTGGSGGEVVVVSSQEDLEKYASADGKYVIKVSGTITITPKGTEVKVASDKTIVGVGADAEINEGGFNLQNQRNVIFRNIKIGNTYVEGDEEGKTQDFDGIQMDNCTNIWIDHVHLEHGGDGLIDSRKDTTFLTVSWTILRNHNKAFGIGKLEKRKTPFMPLAFANMQLRLDRQRRQSNDDPPQLL
ncbi:pectin lyase fold/virulence factor [Thelonectria olida]|uniref:pectinesterase n=1 Tax=Thelonectria olida TaxID=1576542 RepID=A0A9P8W522_9HYPO|nr:pectin lyase fold/virulence factor [Thelonectria olida]